MKMNYSKINKETIENVLLVPSETETSLILNNFNFTASEINIEAAKLDIDYPYGSKISVQGILHLSAPVDSENKKHSFIPLISKDYEYLNEAVAMKIIFTSQETERIKKYTSGSILLNAAVKLFRIERTVYSESLFIICN
jgi:hypothetical protein